MNVIMQWSEAVSMCRPLGWVSAFLYKEVQ